MQGKFRKKRDLISTKDKTNLFHALIDKELAGCEGTLAVLAQRLKVTKKCLKILKTYSSTEPEIVPQFTHGFSVSSAKAVDIDEMYKLIFPKGFSEE